MTIATTERKDKVDNQKQIANKDLRERIIDLGFFNWQIARKIGISEAQFCRWLREELSETDERRKRIEEVLDRLEKGG